MEQTPCSHYSVSYTHLDVYKRQRLRPVLMTALAMIIGMLPMSMSNSQNAPLGRAVIGGLLVATFATLVFVPCVFALLHGRATREKHDEAT